MNASDDSLISGERLAALEHLVERISASGALLLLIETVNEGLLAVPAYAAGSYKSLTEQLIGKAVLIPNGCIENDPAINIFSTIHDEIKSANWFSDSNLFTFLYHNNMQNSDEYTLKSFAKNNFLIIVESASQDFEKIPESYLFDINSNIFSNRDSQFKTAILRLHQAILQSISEKELIDTKFFQFIADEIGPCEFIEENCLPYCENTQTIQPTFLPTESAQLQCMEPYDPLKCGIVAIKSRSISVPLKDISYELKSHRFTTDPQIKFPLKKVYCVNKNIIFSKFNCDEKIQTYFTPFDRQIAITMLDLVQGIISRNISDHLLYEIVTEEPDHFLNLSLNPDMSPHISQDKYIRGVAELFIDVSGDSVEIESNSVIGDVTPSPDYISRLRKFCRKFYLENGNCDRMQVGIDIDDEHIVHEFHMPSTSGEARIFNVYYHNLLLPCSTFDSVIGKMENLFLRLKRHELMMSRSSYMTEARHAVIHYFSLARASFDIIKNEWDFGIKNRENWLTLLQDEEMPKLIDNVNWSLNHASLILENGRFLVNDVDAQTINKKNYNPEDIIANCQRILQFQRRKKNLKWSQKIEGKRPSYIYGDAMLLQIAFLNIFDNAVKYAPNSSRIKFVVSYGRDSYRFSLTNSGDMIDAERLSLFLQMGYRGRQRDQLNVRPGTGLGLPVSNKILLAHSPSAELKLESNLFNDEYGGGVNTFYFDMPYLTGVEHWVNHNVVRGDSNAS